MTDAANFPDQGSHIAMMARADIDISPLMTQITAARDTAMHIWAKGADRNGRLRAGQREEWTAEESLAESFLNMTDGLSDSIERIVEALADAERKACA